jgi:Zn-dependent peptidase ImmA (M78 family)
MSKPDKNKAVHRAKEILEALYIQEAHHINVELIAALRGAYVQEKAVSGAEGRLATAGSEGIITINNRIEIPGKKRFVAAHELGHFELHRGEAFSINCTDKDFRQWYKGNHIEIEANYFAAELLMPEHLFGRKIAGKDVTRQMIEDLANEFNTTMTATAIRFATLRPDYALVCAEDNEIKWFVIDFDQFPYPLNLKGKLHENSMAYEFFNGGELSDKLFSVEHDAWFKWKIRGTIKELAISLGRKYNQTLSFIYVEEGWD